MKKNLAYIVLGAVLSYVAYDGYYYLQVLRWVDGVRIATIQQQAAQQRQQQPPPPAKPQ